MGILTVTFDKAFFFVVFKCKNFVKSFDRLCFLCAHFSVALMLWILKAVTCGFKFIYKMLFVHGSKNSLGQHYIDMTLKSNEYFMVSQKNHNFKKRTQTLLCFSSCFSQNCPQVHKPCLPAG